MALEGAEAVCLCLVLGYLSPSRRNISAVSITGFVTAK